MCPIALLSRDEMRRYDAESQQALEEPAQRPIPFSEVMADPELDDPALDARIGSVLTDTLDSTDRIQEFENIDVPLRLTYTYRARLGENRELISMF